MPTPNPGYDPVRVEALSESAVEEALAAGLAAVAAATDLYEL
jgi:hypothetical protein